MARQRYRPSARKRDLYRYRLRRGVGDAFSVTRRQMRAAVEMQPTGAYDPLSIWDDDWWMAAVDRYVAPVLWEIYWESAADAATAAGRDPLSAYPDIERRWLAQVNRLYRYAESVGRRVDTLSDQGTGESKGWLLDKLGLVAAAGPLSDGIADGMVATEELEAAEGGTSAALGGNGTKTWVASGPNPRPSHAEADGQQVGFDEPFTVGGYDCMFPGDGDLPPEERINCYCSVEYVFEPSPSERSVIGDFMDLVPDEQLVAGFDELVEQVTEEGAWVAEGVVPASDSIDLTLRKYPGTTTLSDEWAEMDPLAQRGNIKTVQAALEESTALINSVHGMPFELPEVSWHQLPNSRSEDGAFTHVISGVSYDGAPGRMLGIRGNSEILHEVVVHESGHYFDWANFDTPAGTWASGRNATTGGWWRSGVWQPVEGIAYTDVSPALRGVMDAIMETPEFRALEKIMMSVGPEGPGAIGEMGTRTFEYLKYLTDPQEMFARAYAQFIAAETGNPALVANIAKGLSGDIWTQWTVQSFEPVQEAFRTMFRVSGLAR